MKKLKALLSMLLILALVLALAAGCAGQSEEAAGSETSAADANSVDTGDDAEDEEPASIKFVMVDLSGVADYADDVVAKIQEIALEEANLDVDIQYVSMGNWQNSVLLSLSAGEAIDVIHMGWSNNVTNMYAAGQLLEIGDELREYAPETLELMADYMDTYTFDGGIYGVPTNRNFCKNGYFLMRKDMLEAVGMVEKAENMTTFSELEEIFAAIKEAYPNVFPFVNMYGMWSDCYVCGTDNFSDYDVYDNLGDSLSMIYCKDDKVQIITDLEAFENECARTAKWYDAGYCWPDAITASVANSGNDYIKEGTGFSTSHGSEFGVEANYSAQWGTECFAVKFADGMVKTSQPSSLGVGVPITSEDPEAACKFINLLYTNSELMNYLIWGIEGDDYTLEDGLVKLSTEGSAYHLSDFLIGNNLLLTPLYGNSADFYSEVAEINQNAVKSDYLGFTFDSDGMDLIITQISAVYDEYRIGLVAGAYTPEKYAEYKEKLEAAGIREYQEAFQTQLDAWLASK